MSIAKTSSKVRRPLFGKLSLQEYIDKAPKVDLHNHLLGGSIPLSTYIKFMPQERKQEIYKKITQQELSADVSEEQFSQVLARHLTYAPENATDRSLGDFMGHYGIASREVPISNPVVAEDTAYEFAKEAIKQNLIYTEIRYNPFLGQNPDQPDVEKALELTQAVERGFERANDESERNGGKKLEYGIIYDVVRHFSKAHHVAVAREAVRQKEAGDQHIVGVGIAGPEGTAPITSIDEAYFQIIHDYNNRVPEAERLGFSVHAGEVEHSTGVDENNTPVNLSPTESVQKSIELGHNATSPFRVGHGVLADFDQIRERLIQNHIGVEMCPSSNKEIGTVPSLESGGATDRHAYQYPALRESRSGVEVSIGTDNATIFGTIPAKEYSILNPTLEDVKRLTINGINTSFQPEAKKRAMLKRALVEFETLDHQMAT